MRFFVIILFFTSFVFVSFNGNAQKNSKAFSSDSLKFIKEITKFLSKGGHKAEAKEIMKDVTEYWQNVFTKGERTKIVSYIFDMQEKRAIAYPHIKNYLLIMVNFKKNKIDKQEYKEWDKIMSYLLSNKKMTIKQIEVFLGTTYNLLTTKTIYRYPLEDDKKPIIEWKTNAHNYKFRFDNDAICKIVFDEFNLLCFQKSSGSVIYETNGTYYPFDRENKWEGIKGIVTWERAGFEKDEMYAFLNKYKINFAKSGWEADSVAYVYKKYFNDPLMGHIEEKIMADVTSPEKATFPQFNSYTRRFKIPKIYEGIDFEGGFTMEGSKFIGHGTRQEPAILNIYKRDSVFLVAKSKAFVFKK